MAGQLGSSSHYDSKEYFKVIEATIEMGASYFLTSFPRTDAFSHHIQRFAGDVMQSFK